MTDTTARTLEERITALEELVAHPLMMIDPGTPALSDKQVAELQEALEAVGVGKPSWHVLPPRPLLTPEAARELLRECVTVVKPGEVLVMSMPDWMTPMHVREVYDVVRYWCDEQAPDLKVMVVPHCDFAVAPEHPEEAA